MSECRFIYGFITFILLYANPSATHEHRNHYLRNVVSELQLINEYWSPVIQYRRTNVDSSQLDDYHQQEASRGPDQIAPDFGPTELADIYMSAIEQGMPIKYGFFFNALNQRIPHSGGRFETINDAAQPDPVPYTYYFYPLQTFHHELANQHGYRIAPNFKYTVPAKNNKDINTMNPLLVGIGSFMGIAFFFLLSLFFYPRFMHFMNFPFFAASRSIIQNEYITLTAFVTEAIDYYNKHTGQKSKRSLS